MTADDDAAGSRPTPQRRGGEREVELKQFREILESCPAGLVVVDDEGRLLFHNAGLRDLLGYTEEETTLFDTRSFWNDLEQRAQIVEMLRERGGKLPTRK